MSALGIIAAKLPNPAGLILAAGITAIGCLAYAAIQAAVRGGTIDRDTVLGGVTVAAGLGLLGLILIAVGAPAFK